MTTKAVKLALAYIYATGRSPTHIRHDTWSVAQDYTKRVGLEKKLTPEGLALIENHPMKIAHDFVTSRGFKLNTMFRRSSSHYINYRKINEVDPVYDDEATVYRHGGANIRTAVVKPSDSPSKIAWHNASYSDIELNDWYKETRK